MRNTLSVLFVLISAMCSPPTPATVKATLVARQKADGLAFYLLSIPKTEFKKDVLLQLATDYVSANGGVNLLQVGVFTEKKVALDFMGKNVFDITYGLWKSEFEDRIRERRFGAAILLKYGPSATLRIRYPDGKIEEIPIFGQNAFKPVVNSLLLNLLHVSFVDQGFGKGKRLVPHLYIQVPQSATSEEAEAFAKSIARLIGTPNIEVYLREDNWFIFDAHYPWVNPFVHEELPPTESEAAKSVEFICKPGETEVCYQSSSGVK